MPKPPSVTAPKPVVKPTTGASQEVYQASINQLIGIRQYTCNCRRHAVSSYAQAPVGLVEFFDAQLKATHELENLLVAAAKKKFKGYEPPQGHVPLGQGIL